MEAEISAETETEIVGADSADAVEFAGAAESAETTGITGIGEVELSKNIGVELGRQMVLDGAGGTKS